jgi:metallo-beta-lactamase family protein
MRIHFNGAAQTVTGSQYLLEVNGYKLLLECGLYQGRRAESLKKNRNFNFDVSKLDGMILSHGHIDHCGNLPNLVKNGFHGPIYATPATKDLTDILVRDSGHIQESDAAYVNKKNAKRGLPPVQPLYTIKDATKVNQFIQPVDYDRDFEAIPGVSARLVDAGHILGSAAIVLDINEKGKKTRLWFSGDIGRPGLPLVRDPVMPEEGIDIMMMECTYGDKTHENPEKAFIEFKEVVLRTIARRGKVIIPAFAVGRTQELVYALNEMMTNGEVPKVPVIVDSPLAVTTSEMFARHPECFDAETRRFVAEHKHPALDFDMLTYTQSVNESKALNDRKEPMIIISASGMAEVGRILHHLKNNVEDARNTVMIVSWQAPHTLGRRIANREPIIKIFGEEYMLKAEVATIGGLSAHAGQNLLVDYAGRVKNQAKRIILVHGETDASTALQEKFTEKNYPPVFYPALYDQFEA